jgi:hypothetical protein
MTTGSSGMGDVLARRGPGAISADARAGTKLSTGGMPGLHTARDRVAPGAAAASKAHICGPPVVLPADSTGMSR